MPAKKQIRLSFRPTQKNTHYLSALGYLDRRNSTAKNNLNKFINDCITLICENQAHPDHSIATPEELLIAWGKAKIAANNIQISDLQEENVYMAKKVSTARLTIKEIKGVL